MGGGGTDTRGEISLETPGPLHPDCRAGRSQPADCLSVHSRLLPSNALLLAAPGPQDSAQFECVVSNEMGEARRLYQVTVQGTLEQEEGERGWGHHGHLLTPPSLTLMQTLALILACRSSQESPLPNPDYSKPHSDLSITLVKISPFTVPTALRIECKVSPGSPGSCA